MTDRPSKKSVFEEISNEPIDLSVGFATIFGFNTIGDVGGGEGDEGEANDQSGDSFEREDPLTHRRNDRV